MKSDGSDFECPPEPPSESATSAIQTSPPPTPSRRAPSPPRWRFVNEAKSVFGYNSSAAGQPVEGKSAQELGAKYIPPDISIYTPKKEKEKVGKLEVKEDESVEEELPEGEFPGLPALEAVMAKEPKRFREWEPKYHVPPKQIKDYAWHDGEMDDLYKACNESLSGSECDVGKFEIHSYDAKEVDPKGLYNVSRKDKPDGDGDNWKLALESSWQLSEHNSETEAVTKSETANESSSTQTQAVEVCIAEVKEAETQTEKWSNKKRCRYLLLLLVLLSVILLGAILGTRSDDVSKEAAAAIAFVVPANASDVPSSSPSVSSSMFPSSTPSVVSRSSVESSSECPDGTGKFSIDHSLQISKDRFNATWELQDACSGEVISKCLPCSLGTLVLGNRNGKNLQEMEILQPTSQCILSEANYRFRVFSTNDPDSCCGFDAATFSLTYGNELYSAPDVFTSLASDVFSYTVHFGDGDGKCNSDAQSSYPSMWPTFGMTDDPSRYPTTKPTPLPSPPPTFYPTPFPTSPPTPYPTRTPVTNRPTQKPLAFVGGCPEKFVPLSYYTIGTQIESEGVVYECTSYSCGSYGFEPGKEGSTIWQQSWDVIGECEGTLDPTPKPSSPPSPYPTSLPTPQPTPYPTEASTICTTKADFNLCLALDNSGSVCNFGIGECLFCEPSLFCQNLFSFLPKQECCQNYVDMINFSKLMVFALGQFEGSSSFSIVQFATSAQLASSLASADETMTVLDNIQFTGGSTDHADAIRQCQNSFSTSDPNRQNFIMLITDGLPSTTYLNPESVAEEEAAFAKRDGTVIIPIFIAENYDAYAESFMTSLSSDGQFFDVTGFQSLDTLKDRLVEQVSCSVVD